MVGFGIRNLTHFEKGFREMHRVLKTGGTFMCLEFSEPVTPWFRCLYDFYSFHVMPLIGKVLANCQPAYTYLPESIRLFPNPGELKSILERIGFQECEISKADRRNRGRTSGQKSGLKAMKLNWAELLVVNNPSRVFQQKFEIGWMRKHAQLPPGGSFLK